MARARLRGKGISQNVNRTHEQRTISFIKLWDEVLSALINKNHSNYGDIRNANFYIDTLGIYSGEDKVSFIYTIDDYPKELELAYRTTLRNVCEGNTRISFITPMERYNIDWGSSKMKARLKTWEILDERTENVTEYNIHENLSTLDNQEWRKQSLIYLSTAEIRRRRKMFKVRTMMIVSGERGESFDNTITELMKLCSSIGIKVSRITGDIPDFLNSFSPFSNTFSASVLKDCGCVTLPDELVARFGTYTQGIIGKEGKYWGTDIYSLYPVYKPVKITAQSTENWLFTAETGGGKSVMVKGIIFQLLGDPLYNGTIMDIEGFEYLPLCDYMGNYDIVSVVNMGEGSGKYFDPVEILLTGNPELDKDMKSLSTSFTLAVLKTLLGKATEQDDWNDIVITDAISLTYAKAGVTDDMDTWKMSKGLTLYDVYKTLKNMIVTNKGDSAQRTVSSAFNNSLYAQMQGEVSARNVSDVERLVSTNENYQKAIEMCIAKMSRYFEPSGIRSDVFADRINIEDVVNAKLVICSFGMAGKSPDTVDAIQMILMQLYAANISHLRSIFSCHNGKFNFKVWEEFQRWGGFPNADKTINVALTGGRKLGDINIIITNKVKDILDDDKFGIFSNITSFALGAIGDADVRVELCRRLTIPELTPELDAIARNNVNLNAYISGDVDFHNPYSKSFLIGLDRTVYTVSRMNLPEELIESKLFRTGVDLKEG